MNKNPDSKAEHAAAHPAAAEPAAAVAPAAKAVRATRTVKAAAASKPAAPAKAARVGRPPAAKKAAAATVAVRKNAKAVPAAAAAKPVAAVKEKIRKPKLVRDSFTMPEAEYAVLGRVKKASLKAGFNVKKSELLRIGVALVDRMDSAQLQAALAALTPVKAGRPKKDK